MIEKHGKYAEYKCGLFTVGPNCAGDKNQVVINMAQDRARPPANLTQIVQIRQKFIANGI